MKRIPALFLLFFLPGCSPENAGDNKKSTTPEKDTVEKTHEFSNEYSIRRLNENNYVFPYINSHAPASQTEIYFGNVKNGEFNIRIKYSGSVEDNLYFSGDKLVAKISSITYNQNYHQQLSVYLFEKQWHTDSVRGEINNPEITSYEITNPPLGNSWFLNAFRHKNGEKVLIASYAVKIPEKEYAAIFEKLNNRKFADFKKYLSEAPEPAKIEYNSLRKLGRFNEGILADLKDLKYDPSGLYASSLFVKKSPPATFRQLYEDDFHFPMLTEEGYDTSKTTAHSLADLYSVKTFSYKTAYPLNNGKDSTLEMQIDFKTKENQATVRFVIGGIVFNEIPRLKGDEMNKGLYLPLGFHSYDNPAEKTESYVLMGNTSGLWMNNTYGRNIDGVLLYFDKTSSLKIHIWLMGGDGTIPVGHYMTTLNKLSQKSN